MNIESDLKSLLHRREPPAGFTERVMARLEDRRSRLSGQAGLPVLHRRAWRAIAAAGVIVMMLGAWGVRVTLHARDELRLAMRITASKVADAQQQVRAASR